MNTSLPKKLGVLLLFVLFANLFFLRPVGQSAFVLFATGFLVFLLSIFVRRQTVSLFRPTLLISSLFFLLLSLNLLTRTSPFTVIIQGFGILVTLFGLLYVLAVEVPFVRSLLEIVLSPLLMLLGYLMGLVDGIVTMIDSKTTLHISRSGRFMNLTKSLLIGLVISAPVCIILVALLSSADPIFAKTVSVYFSWFNLEKLSPRLVFSTIIFAVLFPLLFIKKQLLNDEYVKAATRLRTFSFVNEFTIVIGVVAAIIGLFLLVQWPYVFVKVPFETDLSKFGVATYSEYVKKGFSELLFTALFLYSLIWSGLVMVRNKKPTLRKHPLFYLQLIVLAEFGIFLLSLFRRVFLYQSYHGWSLVRIYGGFLLLWICGITLFLLLRHFQKRRWVVYEALFTAAMFLLVGFFNAEQFIVNTNPPHVNQRIDYVYLSRMSPDGYEGWKQSFAWAQKVLTTNQEKQFLNKDDRRETAYAGVILNQMHRNYDNLVLKYGDRYHRLNYYQKTLSHALPKQKAILLELEKELQSQRDYIRTASPSAQLPEIGQGNTQWDTYYQSMKTSIEVVEDSLKKLGTSEFIDIKVPVSIVPAFFYLGRGTTTNMPCDLTRKAQGLNIEPQGYLTYDSCSELFYSLRKRDFTLMFEPVFLNQVVQWNFHERGVFQQMYFKDVPLSDLLAFEDTYFQIIKRIASQPENERNFEVDISFNTPFL